MSLDRIYGLGPIREALRAGRRRVHRLWVADGRTRDARIGELEQAARSAGATVHRVDREELGRRSGGAVDQGVVAEADPLPRVALPDLLAGLSGQTAALLVVLDSVQDPHNLGAVVRTAECAGAAAVIIPRDRAVHLTPAAVKVAEGAAERLPVVEVVNLSRALGEIQEAGLWCVGLEAGSGRPWCEVDLRRPVALVLGSEGRGIRRLVRQSCDEVASIPVTGGVGSLNVSVAAAVVLFEAVRQRRGGGG